MMNILVSNDDGVMAPGIKILADFLRDLGSVTVVAPDRNRSGASNSLTLTRPIRVQEIADKCFSVEGTPTDCVHLALTGFLTNPVDIVVSGINDGANLGDDILYSGTVAAAMEGRYLGLPAIAVSLVGHQQPMHYDTAAKVVQSLVSKVMFQKLPSQTILNVNVPNLPIEQIQGIQITRLGKRHSAEPIVEEFDPRGKKIYWIGPPGSEADAGQGTDFHAVSHGYVSLTPLHLDMTHYQLFDQLAEWAEQMEFNT